MMTMLLLSLTGFFILAMCKPFLFLSSFLTTDIFSLLMIFIMPIALYCLSGGGYSFNTSLKESCTYLLFWVVVFFVSISFMVCEPFAFLVFLELCVFPMIFLIIFLSKDYDKVSSCFFMVSLNILGSIPFLFFCSNYCDSRSWGSSSAYFSNTLDSSWFTFSCLVLLLVSKLPIFLLHFWLTKAHVSSAGACSMLLASIMLKLGSFGLLKFSVISTLSGLALLDWLIPFSLYSSGFFSLMMIRFFDTKNLVACSSIIHMSFLFPFCVLLMSSFTLCSVLMMVGHGISSLIMFFLITILYENLHSRSFDFSKGIESVSKTLMMVVFLYFCFNFGVPPFINFLSELMVFLSVLNMDFSYFFPILIVMVTYTIFFMFFLTKSMFGKKSSWLSNSSGSGGGLGMIPALICGVLGPLVLCSSSLSENVTLWSWSLIEHW